MLKLKAKCDQMQWGIDIMEKEFVGCIEKAEARNAMSLVIKGNWLKRKSEQTKGHLKPLQDEWKIRRKKKKVIFLVMAFWFFTQFIVDIYRFYWISFLLNTFSIEFRSRNKAKM